MCLKRPAAFAPDFPTRLSKRNFLVTQRKILTTAILVALSGPVSAKGNAFAVEFFGMAPPSTVFERADIYTTARVKATYVNGKSRMLDLEYHTLANTTDEIDGNVVGGLFDVNDAPITDSHGQMASDAPDGNSLMDIPGMQAADPAGNRSFRSPAQDVRPYRHTVVRRPRAGSCGSARYICAPSQPGRQVPDRPGFCCRTCSRSSSAASCKRSS